MLHVLEVLKVLKVENLEHVEHLEHLEHLSRSRRHRDLNQSHPHRAIGGAGDRKQSCTACRTRAYRS